MFVSERDREEARSLREQVGPVEAKRIQRAAYYAAHRDEARAASRAWKQANPDRSRELNRLSMRRAKRRKSARARKNAHSRAWYAEHREQERARARAFRREHPDKVREYQRRYRERHPDRAAEHARRASQRWRDRNADAVRTANNDRARTRREQDPDSYRRWYAANLEQQRERGRAASRLRSRLKKLGLPPRRIHHAYANERRANTAAADKFFTAHRTAQQKRNLQREKAIIMPTRREVLRARGALKKSPPTVTEVARLRGELATQRERERTELTRTNEHEVWATALPTLMRAYAHEHRTRIGEEVRMDSIARQMAGKEPYDHAAETVRRLRIDGFKRAAEQLVPSGDPATLKRLIDFASSPPRPSPPEPPHRDPGGLGVATPVAPPSVEVGR